MERQGADYRERLRDGFLAEAARAENRIHVIDADRSVDVVQAEIRAIAAELLPRAEVGLAIIADSATSPPRLNAALRVPVHLPCRRVVNRCIDQRVIDVFLQKL